MSGEERESESLFAGRTPSAPSEPEPRPKGPPTAVKAAVVVVLVIVVAVVIALKRSSAPQTPAAPVGASVPGGALSAAGLPTLIEIGSVTCIPCKMMKPILDELRAEYAGRLQVDFIDVQVDREAAARFRIRVIPTQVFLDADGREVFRHEGFYPKEEILAKWKEVGVDLNAPPPKPAEQGAPGQ